MSFRGNHTLHLPQCELPAAKLVQAQAMGAGSGKVDLYLCPSGRKAAILPGVGFNPTAGSLSFSGQLKIAGTYWRTATAVAAAPSAANFIGANVMLNEGESFAVDTTGAGLNVFFPVLEFDAVAALKRADNRALVSGYNTIYTCPAGKTASMLENVFANIAAGPGGLLAYVNDTGGSRTVSPYCVKSGGTPSATNRTTQLQSPTSGGGTLFGCGVNLEAGDFISLNTDSSAAGQWAWVHVIEL